MKTYAVVFALVVALSLVVTGLVLANDGIERPRQVLSGGASDTTTGGVTMQASLGQPVIGVISSGEVTLGQGFWHGTAPGYNIYLPLVVK